MNNYQYILTCEFRVNPNLFEGVSNKLEIIMPCISCQRFNRTIVFEDVNKFGICTPRNKCDGFPGKLVQREINKTSDLIKIKYTIDFDYHPFIDKKYKVDSNSTFEFGWARVCFTLRCPICKKKKTISTQENVGRPWDSKCACGNVVYHDGESPFKYELKEKN